MPNRREFFKAVGSTTAGAYLLGHGLGAHAQGARKEIRVGGTRVTTVDIHAHCVFREVGDLIAGTDLDRQFPDWYELEPGSMCIFVSPLKSSPSRRPGRFSRATRSRSRGPIRTQAT